ncbi:MAG: hypothetical protein L0Z50_08950, partial [Verrucomicrobiales bacterium]|nr:hypothetical protein [Verrucomicrobiales bacterium]
EAAVSTPVQVNEKEKGSSLPATDTRPSDNSLSLATAQKTEQNREQPPTKVSPTAKTTVDMVPATNAISPSVSSKLGNKPAAGSAGVTTQHNAGAATNSVIPKTQVQAAQPRTGPPVSQSALVAKPEEKVNKQVISNGTAKAEVQVAKARQVPPENAARDEMSLSPRTSALKPGVTRPATLTFLFAGVALLVLTGLFVWLCFRPSRAPKQPSLISRSLDCEPGQRNTNPPKFLDTRC